jgi:uncharacterized protein YkwD
MASDTNKGSNRGKMMLSFMTVAVLACGTIFLGHSLDYERLRELASVVATHLAVARAEARVEITFDEDGNAYLVEDDTPEVETAEVNTTPVQPTEHGVKEVQFSEVEVRESEKTSLIGDELNHALAEEILRLTNEERVQHGLPPFARHEALEGAAEQHSQEMRELNYFSHTSPVAGRTTPRQRVNEFGVNPQLVAENIFECSGYDVELTSKFAVEAFMKSPGHRQNVLNPTATHIGIGFVAQNGSVSVTQVFGAGL